eukprot:CAMPEP_0184671288 /NCGR_PEP_ID=MMETSP0308-20130426/85407_1 /TAXON_ID=38269 /ORGANISM="Gloeochaete witrockiana, Strain SAG 46.84" /LENGTH=211 /DNA_ID=CAMNT_0027118377 /DNA_START=149 /DNA_END=785 /DNA_ORIENTATION=-
MAAVAQPVQHELIVLDSSEGSENEDEYIARPLNIDPPIGFKLEEEPAKAEGQPTPSPPLAQPEAAPSISSPLREEGQEHAGSGSGSGSLHSDAEEEEQEANQPTRQFDEISTPTLSKEKTTPISKEKKQAYPVLQHCRCRHEDSSEGSENEDEYIARPLNIDPPIGFKLEEDISGSPALPLPTRRKVKRKRYKMKNPPKNLSGPKKHKTQR